MVSQFYCSFEIYITRENKSSNRKTEEKPGLNDESDGGDGDQVI